MLESKINYLGFFWGLFFAVILSGSLQAQNDSPALRAFVLETDPTTYFLEGYSLNAAYAHDRNRYYAELVNVGSIPSFILSNENFEENRLVIGVGYARFLNAPQKGLFLGGDLSNTYSEFSIEESSVTIEQETFKIGLRGGYTFYPIKKLPNLLLSFWLSPRVALNSEDIVIDSEILERPALDFAGALHIGYIFKTKKNK